MLHREFLNLATVGDVTSVNANGVYVTQPDEQSVASGKRIYSTSYEW